MLYRLLILMIFVFTSACSSTGGTLNTDGSFVSNLAINYATLKVIENSGAPVSKARRIVAIAKDTKTLVDAGTLALVPQLEQVVRDKINWSSLDASDTLLVSALLLAVRAELDQRIDGGTLDANTVLTVAHVLDIVIRAAQPIADS
ncbi:MAG: hypothetical protein COB61_004225 [Thiotrichales bacterium]|nr:hypothetical protein [Thiotrichales bacterium]